MKHKTRRLLLLDIIPFTVIGPVVFLWSDFPWLLWILVPLVIIYTIFMSIYLECRRAGLAFSVKSWRQLSQARSAVPPAKGDAFRFFMEMLTSIFFFYLFLFLLLLVFGILHHHIK